MKKSLLAMLAISLVIVGGCSTMGGGKIFSNNKQSVQKMAKEPEKQFLQVLYEKELGQLALSDYLKSVGVVDSEAKEAQVKKQYDLISKRTLSNLKQLKPKDAQVKDYLDYLINFSQLSEKVDLEQDKMVVEYQKNKKISTGSKQRLSTLLAQVDNAHLKVIEQGFKLAQEYASSSTAAVQDFMYVENILHNELVDIITLQRSLQTDKSITNEAQLNKKSVVGLLQVTNKTIGNLKTVKSSDSDMAKYVNNLLERNQLKLKMINKQNEIAAQEAKGKLSSANMRLMNRFQQVNDESSELRLHLIKRLMN